MLHGALLWTELTDLVVDALVHLCSVDLSSSPAVDCEAIFSDDQLIYVDDQTDETLQNHGRKQIHVDSCHFVLAKFPGNKIKKAHI